MDLVRPRPLGQDWLDQIFRAKSADRGGVVRRRIEDVAREIGMDRLELEVRRRGFRMVVCGGHVVIICTAEPVHLIV